MIVVGHRLSTVAEFDRILVIEAGKLIEFSSPRDLLDELRQRSVQVPRREKW